jgi:bifunctional N-acetylglucosamine-1-phosphate-uridyltransferase/glucosamine-1-phosphate-acetyltransferase GlmU-like protein
VPQIDLVRFLAGFPKSWLAAHSDIAPWRLTTRSRELIGARIGDLGSRFRVDEQVAIHRDAVIEPGAVIKGPAIVSADCFIAAGAYLRDGCWLDEGCVIGPGAEVKSSYLFRGVKLAHFNFVGDSLIGAAVNCEAGSVVANHRNEWTDPRIVLTTKSGRIETGVDKFGAIIGDQSRIGANAVLLPARFSPRAASFRG